MIIENITLRCIKAEPGMVLTNGEAFSYVGGKVYLGKFDSVDNWHEITEEEYNAIQEELMNQEDPAAEV